MISGTRLEPRRVNGGGTPRARPIRGRWDQPFLMTTDNPKAAWIYAVPQRLETTRTATVQLPHRPASANCIISCFAKHHIRSHTPTAAATPRAATRC